MYSAVSVNGQRLYQLARQGIEVERPARQVVIARLELVEYDPAAGEGALRVECSKGTYIRTLIEDVAKAAGSCGTMTALRRVRACGFSEGEALPLDRLKELAGARGAGLGTAAGGGAVYRVPGGGGEPRPGGAVFQRGQPGHGPAAGCRGSRCPRGSGCGCSARGSVFGLAAADPDQGQLKFVKLFQGAEGTV